MANSRNAKITLHWYDFRYPSLPSCIIASPLLDGMKHYTSPWTSQQNTILQRFTSLVSPFEKLTFARLPQSRAQRILWLLEELKVVYVLKTYKRKSMLAPPELKEIHPLGKSPLLTVEAEGASEPLVLAESANIVEYLVDHYGNRLVPKRYPDGKDGQIGRETEEWMRYRYYMHYAEGTLMPYLIVKLLINSRFMPLLFQCSY